MPSINVLNELQIKQNGVTTTYKLGTVNGYYNTLDGKFYQESTYVTEIAGAPNLVYADIGGNNLYIWKASTSSFVKVSGEGGVAEDNIKFGYLNSSDGLFYEDDSYTVEIPGNADHIYVGLDNDTIYRYDTGTTSYIAIGGGGGGATYTAGDGIIIDTENENKISADVNGTTIIIDANDKIAGNYEGDYNIKIDGNKISTKTFVGTTAEWEALTAAQKLEYDSVNITDDSVGLNTTPGHTIEDETTSFPQRTNLQFEGFNVTDDSTNDITKVAEVPYTAGRAIDIDTNKEIAVKNTVKTTFVGTTSEWEALTTTEKAEYELVSLTDDPAGGDMYVEDAVTKNSINPVTSGAVFDAINGKVIGGNTGSTVVPGNGYTDVDISFGTTYTKSPKSAVATMKSTGSVSNFKDITVCCYSFTTTGFKVRFYNGTSNELTLTANWIAVF